MQIIMSSNSIISKYLLACQNVIYITQEWFSQRAHRYFSLNIKLICYIFNYTLKDHFFNYLDFYIIQEVYCIAMAIFFYK